MALSLASMPLTFAGASHTAPSISPRMGLGYPSPKDLSNDPAIPDVLAVAKVEQTARLARLATQASSGFSPGGVDLMMTLPGVLSPMGYFDPLDLVCKAAHHTHTSHILGAKC